MRTGTHWTWEIMRMLQRGEAVYEKWSKEICFIEMCPPTTINKILKGAPTVYNTHIPWWGIPQQFYRGIKSGQSLTINTHNSQLYPRVCDPITDYSHRSQRIYVSGFKVPFHSTPSGVRLTLNGRGGHPTPRNRAKRPHLIDLGCTLRRPNVCFPESPTCLRSLIHRTVKLFSTDHIAMFTRFLVSYWDYWQGKQFDFATIFTRLTIQSCTGKRVNLQWKNSVADWLAFEITCMSWIWLPFPETQVRHHWLDLI